jgi:hypothetical protein
MILIITAHANYDRPTANKRLMLQSNQIIDAMLYSSSNSKASWSCGAFLEFDSNPKGNVHTVA